MGVTIHDVARRAGVSISTVSRVLNDTANVSADKRARVEAAAGALGYSPNPAARSLLGRTTGGLGVLFPYITGEFFSELLLGIDTAAREHGYFLFVSSSHRNADEFARALREIGRRVDGLLVMATQTELEAFAELPSADVPVVLLNTPPFDDALDAKLQGRLVDTIRFDNHGGAYAVAEHLVAQGARRLALVRGPDEAYDAEERLRGTRDALRDNGLAPDALRVYAGDFSQEAGYRAGQEIARLGEVPDAVVACSDLCAIGVLLALREAGLRVPDDVAIAGFDDIPTTRYISPPLTTARVPLHEVGTWAVGRVLDRVRSAHGDGGLAPEHVTLPVELVARASTGGV